MTRPFLLVAVLLTAAACGGAPSTSETALTDPTGGSRERNGSADTVIHSNPGNPSNPGTPQPDPEVRPSHPAADAPLLEQVDLVLAAAGGSVDVSLVNRRTSSLRYRRLDCSLSWQRKDGAEWKYVGEPVECPGDFRFLAAGATTTVRVAAPTTAGTWRLVTEVGDAETLALYAVSPVARSAAFVVP